MVRTRILRAISPDAPLFLERDRPQRVDLGPSTIRQLAASCSRSVSPLKFPVSGRSRQQAEVAVVDPWRPCEGGEAVFGPNVIYAPALTRTAPRHTIFPAHIGVNREPTRLRRRAVLRQERASKPKARPYSFVVDGRCFHLMAACKIGPGKLRVSVLSLRRTRARLIATVGQDLSAKPQSTFRRWYIDEPTRANLPMGDVAS